MRVLVVLSAVSLMVLACGSPQGTRVTPDEYARLQPPPAQLPAPAAAATAGATKALGDELLGQQHKLEERATTLERGRQDLERDRAELERERHRTAMEHQGAEASETLALERAEHDHAKAVEDREHLSSVEVPRRLEEDALGVRTSWDNLLEVREELAQLEMMYDGSSLGDATAEIVLNRTKRRLERMEASHTLREQRSAELKDRTLPRELADAELEVRARTVALEDARRKLELGRLSREAALRKLDEKALELERKAADLERDGKLLAEDEARFEKKAAAERAAPGGLNAPTGALP